MPATTVNAMTFYWAEIYGSRATSRFRPKGLERACVLAEARLRRAQ
jgi:hypothetical protein